MKEQRKKGRERDGSIDGEKEYMEKKREETRRNRGGLNRVSKDKCGK